MLKVGVAHTERHAAATGKYLDRSRHLSPPLYLEMISWRKISARVYW